MKVYNPDKSRERARVIDSGRIHDDSCGLLRRERTVAQSFSGRGFVRAAAVLASMLLSASVVAASVADLDETMRYDGLERIKVKDVDLAYARPGATLSGYKHVMLEPVNVAFRKDWKPTMTGSQLPIGAREQERIRTGIAKIVAEEFTKELQAKDGYDVVSETGPDVLRVRANIVNLYVTAPDTSVGRSRTYTVSAGEMTIFMELHDSETGELLARFVDRRQARDTGRMFLSNSTTNAWEARDIASSWARILRKGLDKAHRIGAK